MHVGKRVEDILSELGKDYALDTGIDGCVGEDLRVLAQVGEIAQSENEGFIAAEGMDECLVRGKIHLDLTEAVRGKDFGLGSVTSDDGDIELARSDEGVEHRLAKRACGLVKESEGVNLHNINRRTPTWTMFLYAIARFRVVDRVGVTSVVYWCVC